MVRSIHGRFTATVVACAVTILAVSACGSSAGTSTSRAGAQVNAADSTGAGAGRPAAAIAPYLGKPSPFPVVGKLARVPNGATIDYMDSGTPVGALFYQLLKPAAAAMGVRLNHILAGHTASSVTAAFQTAVTEKPAAVVTTSIDVQLWANELKQLQGEKVPVVTSGITGTAPYHLPAPQQAEADSSLEGKLMADYVAAKFGQKSNAVFYDIPELTFTEVVGSAFKSELARVCPSCAVRTSPISAASIGNSAPSTVVSDLEAHPATTVAVFGSDEAESGLPAALRGAGLSVKTMGVAPTPENLQYVKDGQESVTLGYDLPVAAWELLDQAVREIDHQPLSGPAAQGDIDLEFLTQKNITFDPAQGWTGYPDFAQRFTKLWGVTG